MANRLETGKADANIGGGVYKIRLARSGEGKSGGYRIIVFYKIGECMFFIYGFAKSDRSNINDKELKTFKEAAKEYFHMTSAQIKERIEHGQLIEL
ncbi:MAG: type II toxin-antitoxin system RelE/ParE family toxin [Nitrososphaerota archaeon]|nr:type II toxin-antitoxin system RelE/ParE family toxin [Nitrososphaerota archaeon]